MVDQNEQKFNMYRCRFLFFSRSTPGRGGQNFVLSQGCQGYRWDGAELSSFLHVEVGKKVGWARWEGIVRLLASSDEGCGGGPFATPAPVPWGHNPRERVGQGAE